MVVGVTNFNTAKTHWWLTFHLGYGLGTRRQIFECVRIVRSVGHSARALHDYTLMMLLPRSITATALLGAMSQLYDVVLFC